MLLQIFLRETDSLQFYAEKDTSVKPHENMRITNKVRYKRQLRGGVKPHENMRFTNKVRYKVNVGRTLVDSNHLLSGKLRSRMKMFFILFLHFVFNKTHF